MLESQLQRTCSLRFEHLGLQLQVAALVVDGHAPAHSNRHTVLRAEAQEPDLRAPHDHAQLGGAVLQREVKVSGLGRTAVGDLAFHVDVGEGAFDLGAERGDQFADRINFPRRSGKDQSELFGVGHLKGSVTQ